MPDHRGQLANILFAWLMVTPQILLLRLALSNDIVAGSLAAATSPIIVDDALVAGRMTPSELASRAL